MGETVAKKKIRVAEYIADGKFHHVEYRDRVDPLGNSEQYVAFSLTAPHPALDSTAHYRQGQCAICSGRKNTLVNDICLECAGPKRKGKYVVHRLPRSFKKGVQNFSPEKKAA